MAPLAACAEVPAPASSSQFAAWAQTHQHPAVARVVAPGDGSISYGSGTLVYADDQRGIVITNWHVVNEATQPVSVHFPDGFYSVGNVQNVDRDWDLAAIVIRKPPGVTPVAMADRAPQPGETLTIAGYGSGQYRAASGPCTQYVAPGLDFPYEMVEVATSARQGDSGGPIFNSRGQLAGVLFGEGHGRTSGSYCGRVRWFLTSVVPNLRDAGMLVAGAPPLENVPARPLRTASHAADAADGSATASGSAPAGMPWPAVPAAAPCPGPVVASTPSPGSPPGEVVQIGWHDIAGETLGEQFKTVLAGIGLLALVLQVLRWISREPAKA